ncbi:hypothetical protein PRIPAC_88878 [Pristionchus pacificus]|uniref:Uncharacterized protein n=1 Tax=Pristionchus pacificus TaxID=54126 RepID=A0A2A6B6W6_PRIPA|nr:hypothetical protein PRIPAC_88878 [Pristionchus pacificus]|eukprot:PDM61593.1 hypothetical protein PRIPAC_51035 [Pristionchus pacificus]
MRHFNSFVMIRCQTTGSRHDMRTFGNISFQWMSIDDQFNIPDCHGFNIRRSYYETATPIVSLSYAIQKYPRSYLKTGHLVYLFLFGVVNETGVRNGFFAAAAHKVYADKDLHPLYKISKSIDKIENMDPLIEIVIISEKTWLKIWKVWTTAGKKGISRPRRISGVDLCDGGKYFDRLLPRIFKDAQSMPQYNDLVGNYTDVTSDASGRSETNRLDGPKYRSS